MHTSQNELMCNYKNSSSKNKHRMKSKLVKNSSSKHKHEMRLKLLNCALHSYCAMGSHNIEDEIQMHSLRIKPPNKKMLVALIALKLSLSMVLSPDHSFVLNSELSDILKLSKVQ